MAKILTSSTKTKVETEIGTEPIFILKINWASGIKYYADREYTFDGNVCESILLNNSEIQSQGKEGSIGEISAIDFTLDDTNGDLKNLINTDIIEGVEGIAYHHYVDLPPSAEHRDAIVLLAGRLAGPIDWSEGERIFSASLESYSATGVGEVGYAPAEDEINNLLESAEGKPWPICFGSPRMVPGVLVQQIEPTEEELEDEPDMTAHSLIYIINLYSSSSVAAVFAKRNCYGDPGFFQVPSEYYTINTSYSYGGKTVTAILMSQPLSTRDESGWSNEIYVSLVSSLSENTATQIKWILDNYSSLSTDAASFTAVATKINDLASHWVLFDQPDSLKLAEEMAWQARCALFVKNNTVYIKFLAEVPQTDNIITKDSAKLKSLNLSFTSTEDIITKFKAEYVTDYSGDEKSDKEYIYTNNTDQFGVKDDNYDFFIYTNPACVKVAATFWGYRYSNSWRKLQVTTFLKTLSSEAYDWLLIDLPIFSTNQLPGIALSVNHDSENHEISFEFEMASSAGTHINSQPSLDANYYSAGDQFIETVGIPVASVDLKTICEPLIDEETITKIIENGDVECIKCRVIGGSSSGFLCHEISGIERDGTLLLIAPTKNNQDPAKIVFTTNDSLIGLEGCCYSAASNPQWVDYDLNPGIHPGYSDDNRTKPGDIVGTIKNQKKLSKKHVGFNVVGVNGGEIAVTNGSLDPKLEKIYADDALIYHGPTELTGVYVGEAKAVKKPSEDSLPPGKIMFPIEDIDAGEEGLAYNAFDVTGWPDGAEPSEIGVEVGTKADSFEIQETNDSGSQLTGFIVTGRKGGKNQVRPF
jgi:hypothetical protein